MHLKKLHNAISKEDNYLKQKDQNSYFTGSQEDTLLVKKLFFNNVLQHELSMERGGGGVATSPISRSHYDFRFSIRSFIHRDSMRTNKQRGGEAIYLHFPVLCLLFAT